MEEKEFINKEAVAELQSIVRKKESDSCDIDSLSAYKRRALELLKHCKERLRVTNDDVVKCLQELKEQLSLPE